MHQIHLETTKQYMKMFDIDHVSFLGHWILLFCLFDLVLYIPSTIFQLNRDGSSWVEPVLS